jgi:putative transposase
MPRSRRCFIEGQPLHVIQRGNNRTPIFTCEEDFLYFELCLGEAISEFGVAVHAIVLMTNHVHLLATPEAPQSLPKAMQSLGRRYVQHFNRLHHRTGTLWEGRYRSTIIDTRRYFLTCMCYIERNPERAGIVKRPAEYRWSSYRANALGDDCGVVLVPHRVYLDLGRTGEARRAVYRQLFRRPLPPDDIEVIRHATNRAWVIGRDSGSETTLTPSRGGSESSLTPTLG